MANKIIQIAGKSVEIIVTTYDVYIYLDESEYYGVIYYDPKLWRGEGGDAIDWTVEPEGEWWEDNKETIETEILTIKK